MQKRLAVSAQYCSQHGLQTGTARTEHGKFFAMCMDTKNTAKVKKKYPLQPNRRKNLDIEMECNYLLKLEFDQDTLA